MCISLWYIFKKRIIWKLKVSLEKDEKCFNLYSIQFSKSRCDFALQLHIVHEEMHKMISVFTFSLPSTAAHMYTWNELFSTLQASFLYSVFSHVHAHFVGLMLPQKKTSTVLLHLLGYFNSFMIHKCVARSGQSSVKVPKNNFVVNMSFAFCNVFKLSREHIIKNYTLKYLMP